MLDDPPEPTLTAAVAQLAAAWDEAFRHDMAVRGFAWHLSAAGDLLRYLGPVPVPQSMLPTASGLTKQAIQQSLDQLESLGVLRRIADPADRRAKLVELTELGQADRAAASDLLQAREAAIRDLIGRKAAKKLRKTLRQLLPQPQIQ